MTYVAFLRGINVGGNSIVSMADIKEAVTGAGFANVRTYINSGNVIFSSAASDTAKLASKIEMALAEKTGMAIKALVFDHRALKKIVAAIPATWVDGPAMRCYVMLLWAEVNDPEVLKQLPSNPDIDDVKYVPGAVIWRIDRENVTRSRMGKIAGTRFYKLQTTRNANTVRKLDALMAAS